MLCIFLLWRRQKKRREADLINELMEKTAVPFNPTTTSTQASGTLASPSTATASKYPHPSKLPLHTAPRAHLRPLSHNSSTPSGSTNASNQLTLERRGDADISWDTVPLQDSPSHFAPATNHAGASSPTPPDPRNTRQSRTVAGLLNQLNDLLSRLPLGDIDEEEPPEYDG